MKNLYLILSLLCFLNTFSQNPDLKYLEVEFLDKIEPYTRNSGIPFDSPLNASTILKLKFINKGKKGFILNLKDVYALDRNNDYYPVNKPSRKKTIKIKANQSIKKSLHFNMPDNEQPVKLLIDRKVFELYL